MDEEEYQKKFDSAFGWGDESPADNGQSPAGNDQFSMTNYQTISPDALSESNSNEVGIPTFTSGQTNSNDQNQNIEVAEAVEIPKTVKTPDAIFWIEVEKISPNPLQPRREFDETGLQSLAQSIREYGVLQPLVVSRIERDVPSGQIVEYELLAGERRLRAAKIARLERVPAIVRHEPHERLKLELALIENVQREDLNPIDRAIAFKKLVDDFNMLQKDLADKIGKSREMVSNTLRLLLLPLEIQEGLRGGTVSEGHARSLLALAEHEDTQRVLYQEIVMRNLSVRDAERISRRLRQQKEKRSQIEDPDIRVTKQKLEEALGTRVNVNKLGSKWKISIEFFSDEELHQLLKKISRGEN